MNVDTVIVGAGTAGLSALREVRRWTDDVLLVNAGHWGTTCAASACMPSKALIEVANAFHARHAFDGFGIAGREHLHADIRAVLAHVRRLRDDFTSGPARTPERLGDRALQGRARLDGPNRVVVGDRTIEARAIILATGSRPIVPGSWDGFGDRILTTDTLFEQPDLPRRIAVVGLGAVGVEIGQALARLGHTVGGFDQEDRIAGIADPAILDAFRPLLRAEMTLHLGAPAELHDAGEQIRVSGGGGDFTADAVLAALGRRPNIDGLGLDTLGVPLDAHGLPPVDPQTLRIGDLDVFLAGDANADRPLLHEAADEGHIAGRAAGPQATPRCRRTPLSITFTAPQIARVGPPVSDLPETRITAQADFSRQARARMTGTAAGLLRVHADPDTARLLAAEMCVPGAEHLAHLLALAIERGMTVADMLAMPVYHPVLEEGLRGALRDLFARLPDLGGSDLSACEDLGHEALD